MAAWLLRTVLASFFPDSNPTPDPIEPDPIEQTQMLLERALKIRGELIRQLYDRTRLELYPMGTIREPLTTTGRLITLKLMDIQDKYWLAEQSLTLDERTAAVGDKENVEIMNSKIQSHIPGLRDSNIDDVDLPTLGRLFADSAETTELYEVYYRKQRSQRR